MIVFIIVKYDSLKGFLSCHVKVIAFFGLIGIRITDLSTIIPDLRMLIQKGMNYTLILIY